MTSPTYQSDAAEPVPTTGLVDGYGSADTSAESGTVLSRTGRPRTATATTTAEIDTAITHPGSVRINVKGAFIVDQGSSTSGVCTPANGQNSPTGHHQTKDIRLPNHTAVVSHVAIDVCPAAHGPFKYRKWLTKAVSPADWRFPGQAGVFLARSALHRTRRPAQLPHFRNGPHTRLHRVYEAA